MKTAIRASSLVAIATLSACVCFGPRESAPEPMKKAVEKAPAPPMSDCGPGMISSKLYFPTGMEASSSIRLVKCAPEEVSAGDPIQYEIQVTNLTSHAIHGVSVIDTPGPGFSMTSSNPSGTPGMDGDHVYSIGTLDGGSTKTVVINGNAGGSGTVRNCASIAIDNETCVETRVVDPRLSVTKTGPAEVSMCDPIDYTITVMNDGTGTIRNIDVTDSLPDGLTASGATSMTIAELGPGQTRTFTVAAKASSTGTYENSAFASAEGGVSASSETVTTRVVQPALDLAMNCPGKVYGGQQITYRLAVSNTGDAACNNTVVEATIPDGTSFASATEGGQASGGKVRWVLSTVAPGGSKEMSFTVGVGLTALGPKTSDATATCVCADPVDASCTTTVAGIPAILLEVVDAEDPIAVGNDVTYVITATNQGSLADTNIIIVCQLEDEMQFVSAAGDTTGSADGSTVTFGPLPSLAPKAKATWRVTVKAASAGDVRFSVEMNTDQLTRPVNETEATNFYE